MAVETVPLYQLDINLVYTFTYSGILSPETTQMRLYNDTGKVRTISSVRASVGASPVGSPIRVNILKNGISIFGSQSTGYPSIHPGSHTGKSTPTNKLWGVDEFLTVSIAQIGSDFPGEDLTINVIATE